VAPAGAEIVIAGGSRGNRASRAVYAFDPARRTVRTLARLPRPLTHSAAVALNGAVYLLGGRGAGATSQTRRILSIDVRTGAVRDAGLLPRPLSDAAVAAVAGGGGVLAGGLDRAGRVRGELFSLVR
jgi:hypothetical protein